MIIKINFNGNVRKHDATRNHWFFMDNVRRFTTEILTLTPAQLSKWGITTQIIIDPVTKDDNNFVLLNCYVPEANSDKEREYSILFNTVGYILNDVGETIEKLVC